MGKHTDIFPADLGQRPASEIGHTVLHGIQESEGPGTGNLEACIDAFQHVFETAADRTQRELDVFLAYVPLLADRIGRTAQQLEQAGEDEVADALRKRVFPTLKLVVELDRLEQPRVVS
jgi:hypothetical protein